MIKVYATVEYVYTFEDEEEEKIETYTEENQVSLYSAFIDLFDSGEIDLDTHDKDTTEPTISVVDAAELEKLKELSSKVRLKLLIITTILLMILTFTYRHYLNQIK